LDVHGYQLDTGFVHGSLIELTSSCATEKQTQRQDACTQELAMLGCRSEKDWALKWWGILWWF